MRQPTSIELMPWSAPTTVLAAGSRTAQFNGGRMNECVREVAKNKVRNRNTDQRGEPMK
ncbi:hypothetical protein RRSWK_03578 [Rhodopirellula sp. SWK7]|nr:hypothetical protein RRSWK_03578 [Rhodopirellula sp. SWK7]